MKSHDLKNPEFLMRRAAVKLKKATAGLNDARSKEGSATDIDWTIGQLEAAIILLRQTRGAL